MCWVAPGSTGWGPVVSMSGGMLERTRSDLQPAVTPAGAALAGPPVAPALDGVAWIVTEVRGADHQQLQTLGACLVAAPRSRRHAHRVPLAQLDDLVVDLHAPAAADDDVHLLLRPVRMAVGEAIAGRDALMGEAGLLELERLRGRAELQVGRPVEHLADVL